MKFKFLFAVAFFFFSKSVSGQSPIGIWETYGDSEGSAESWIEIYEHEGIFYGKIVKIFRKDAATVCRKCPGEKKNQPVLGMEIISGLTPYENYWNNGKVLFPKDGNTYNCYIKLEGKNQLTIRGYYAYSWIGKTEVWTRVLLEQQSTY